ILNSGFPRANELLPSEYRKRLQTHAISSTILFQTCHQKAAAIVRDLIITPDETDPYGAIKAQLIQRTGESPQQEIRKLLTGEELGDRKSSELLKTVNRRASSHNVPKELMLETFSSVATDLSANYLGIHHANNRRKSRRSRRQNPRSSIPNVSLSTNAIASSSENRILQDIERLNGRIDDLTMRQKDSRAKK
ncbi:transposon Tf2-6 polyprotein, partial [Trichonephila clavata]